MTSLFKRYKMHLGIMGTFMLGFAAACLLHPAPASAGDLDKILNKGIKIVGIGVVVDKFGPDINKFINQFLNNSSAPLDAGSKVVEIISPIGGKHIGACQVTGPQDQVDKVGAVVQLETNATIGTRLRMKAMIPIQGHDPSHFKRVAGVGVSAIIDIKL